MLALQLGFAALLPSVLLVLYFHRSDQYPEPPGVLWRTFGLGVLIVIPVVLVALPLDALASTIGNPLLYGFASAFLGAAIPEEFFKFVVLYYYAARHMEFDEPMDGLVYGATASLGFATLENVLYVISGGVGVAVMRAFLAVPSHAFLGAIMGYFVARAKFEPENARQFLVRALVVPTVLHGLYDTPLLATELLGEDPTATATGCIVVLLLPLAPAIVLGEWIWTVRLVRRFKEEQLAVAAALPATPSPAIPLVPSPTVPVAPSPRVPVASPHRVAHPEESAWPLAIPADAHIPVPASGPSWREQILAWAFLLGGGALALLGGLVILGLVFAMQDPAQGEEIGEMLLGGAIIGVLPALVGMGLFFFGIHRLNRKQG